MRLRVPGGFIDMRSETIGHHAECKLVGDGSYEDGAHCYMQLRLRDSAIESMQDEQMTFTYGSGHGQTIRVREHSRHIFHLHTPFCHARDK